LKRFRYVFGIKNHPGKKISNITNWSEGHPKHIWSSHSFFKQRGY